MSEAGQSYNFGSWIIDPHLNRIRNGSIDHQLEPKAMEVLAYLLARPGEVVSTAELLDQVWAGRMVEDNAIQQRISKIRRLLGDDPRSPAYIKTVSRKGYQTIAPVSLAAAQPFHDANLSHALRSQTPPFPAYTGSGNYVFVCYAHVDRAVVYPELARLRDAGVNIWYDEGIRPGSSWTDELAAALSHCSQVLFYVSPNSVLSENCLGEISFAADRRKPMVIVHMEPTQLPGGLELTIGRNQALLKYGMDDFDYWRKLVAAVQADAAEVLDRDQIPTHGHAPEPATPSKTRRWGLLAGVLAVVTLGGGLSWYLQVQQNTVPTSSSVSSSVVDTRPRLAVLPFAEFDGSGDLIYLSEGIANDIRHNLVTSPELVLVARASSARFSSAAFSPQELREQLGVSHVVSGQLRQRGERLLVTVELTDAHTGTLLWSNRFDRSTSELFTIERQIAADVLQSLNLKPILTSARDAVHPDAYAAYLLGQHIFFKDMVAAREQFLRALEIQPDFADAQAFVGWSHLDQGNFGLVPTIEAYPKAQASISRALAIDPANVNALLANSVINMALNHDYQTLFDTAHDVLKRDPTNERVLLIYGAILEVFDRSAELLRLSDYWLSVDPLNSEARRQRLAALIAADELSLPDIRQELNELESLSARLAHSTMELTLALRTKDQAGALKILQTFKSPRSQMLAKYIERDLQAARQLAQTVIANPKTMPQTRARAWLVLGDVDKAAAVASQALDEGHIQILSLLRDSARAATDPGLALPFFSGSVLDRLLRQARLDAASMAQITVHPLPFDKSLWNR